MRRRKRNNLITTLVLLLLSIGLGYAFLTQDLTINGTGKIKGNNWSIHFDNLQVSSGSVALSDGDVAAAIDSNDDTLVSYTITLPKPGDYYEFTVDVVNDGTLDGMVGTITNKLNGTEIGATNPLPSYLNYSVTYKNGVAIEENHLLEVGHTETYKIRLEFKKDIENSELPTTTQTNTFSFGVDYIQKTEAAVTIPLPRTIIKAVRTTAYDYPESPTSNKLDFSDNTAFRNDNYINKIKTITLDDKISPPANFVESWDISVGETGDVMAYLTVNLDDNTMYDLYIQGNGSLYANPDSSYLFARFHYLDAINNIEALDTSLVTKMAYMFSYTGSSSQVFTLNLGNNFDTSNVTDMGAMFYGTGSDCPAFTLDLGPNFDTSKVTRVFYHDGEWSIGMFDDTGSRSQVFTLDLGDKFDTSNITNMNAMFAGCGAYSPVFTLDLGDKFDTSNVTSMNNMFYDTGRYITNLDLGDKFDTSKVTSMYEMFRELGYYSLTFTLDLGDKFDTSSVINMGEMFRFTGCNSSNFTLNLGANFDTSSVTNMNYMFSSTGSADSDLELDLSAFDFSNVRYYTDMFDGFPSTGKIWVKDAATQSWLISHADNYNLTSSNVLIKGA